MSSEAARVCREAAAVIEERGHAKTELMTDDGRVCMWGALGVAYNSNPRSLATDVAASVGDDPDAFALRRSLVDFFGRRFHEWTVMSEIAIPGSLFNDRSSTTPQDVQKLLLSAADEIEFQAGAAS